jgi:hypothetical protein
MWWKGLVLFAKEEKNNWQEVVAGDYIDLQQPEYPKRDVILSFQNIKTNFFCLSKAKGFGVHVNVYHVVDAATELQSGKKYRIT